MSDALYLIFAFGWVAAYYNKSSVLFRMLADALVCYIAMEFSPTKNVELTPLA